MQWVRHGPTSAACFSCFKCTDVFPCPSPCSVVHLNDQLLMLPSSGSQSFLTKSSWVSFGTLYWPDVQVLVLVLVLASNSSTWTETIGDKVMASAYFVCLSLFQHLNITRPSDRTPFHHSTSLCPSFVLPTHPLAPAFPCLLSLPCPTCSSHSPLWLLVLDHQESPSSPLYGPDSLTPRSPCPGWFSCYANLCPWELHLPQLCGPGYSIPRGTLTPLWMLHHHGHHKPISSTTLLTQSKLIQ